MALDDFVTFAIEGLGATLAVAHVYGVEALGAPFRFTITCSANDGDAGWTTFEPKDALTRDGELVWTLPDGGSRVVKGLVERVEARGRFFRIELVSPLALLADAVEQRVLLDEDAVTIVTAVLAEHGLSADVRTTRTPPARPQCVQAFESDLAFVSRLLAEEGITFYVLGDDPTKVVLADAPSSYDDVPGADALRVAHGAGMGHAESVRHTQLRHRRTTESVTLRDLDFRKPMTDLTVTEGQGSLVRAEYPGGYNDPGIGAELAKMRLEEAQSRGVTLRAETSSPRLFAGGVVTLTDAARDDTNGRWLLCEVRHTLRERGAGETNDANETRYAGSFVAVPADAPHRPPRPIAPSLGGVQTVTTTGAAGSEIHTEEYGRIKAHLRWDRRRPSDDTSSKWFRVAQPALSGGFLQPRVGWEQLVGFYGSSADSPIALGRLYHGASPPPEGLPGKKVVSAFGTQTTPGGGSANVMRLDDTAGNEGFALTASKDLNERTENDKKTSVTADDSLTVGANHTLIVGQVHQVGVQGAQTYSVAASRTVNVDANKAIKAGSETVMVGGVRSFDVGGDQGIRAATLTRLVGGAKLETAIEHQKRHVTGASTTLVGGSWVAKGALHATTSVGGAHTELVGGAKSVKTPKYSLKVRGALKETLASRSVKAGGDRGESFGAAALYDVTGAMTVKGADVVVTAKTQITLKAGGATITITPGSVKIDCDYKSSTGAVENGQVEYP
jgi:type VI secretion system secreted protein VgrG